MKYLRRNLHLSPLELQKLQLKKLKAIVSYAYDNVPFYHQKFDLAGVKPFDLVSLEDLTRFPVITKQEIQSAPPESLIARNPVPYVKRSTSGSTGIPLTVAIDKTRVAFENVIWLRALFANGFSIRDKMVVINDPRNFPKSKSVLQKFGIMRSKYVSIFDDAKSLASACRSYKPDIIKGYPSSIELLARELNKVNDYKARLIFTSAEVLDPITKKLLNSISQDGFLDNYACSEFSLLAWECRKHEGYHINADSVAMEFISDGEAVASGESGEIICTSLSNTATPLIRYKIGDRGVPVEDKCSCGVTLPLMKIVEGRTDDFLIATDGHKVPPTIFFPYPFESFDDVKGFKVIQETKNKLRFQLVVTDDFSKKNSLQKATSELKSVFGADMNIEFEFLSNLDKGQSRKLRKVISLVSKEE